MPAAASRKKTAKPGEFVIAQHGGIVGIVLEVIKDKKHGPRYEIAAEGGPFWVFHKELLEPRRGNFDDLVRFYDSSVRLFDRMAGLVNWPGAGDLGERVQANIFDLITAAVLELSAHKKPDILVSRRVMLDFGRRAGFDEAHMAAGRSMFECAA
jgi:hypothetical protein